MRPENSVRIGHKPGIYQAEDRWGRPVSTWYATECGWFNADEWSKMQDYQTPISDELLPKTSDFRSMTELMKTPFAEEMNRKMNLCPQAATVWQFNVITKMDKDEAHYMRLLAPLGAAITEPTPQQREHFERHRIVEWSWWDAHIQRRWWRLYAWLKTKLSKEISYEDD